MESVDWRIIDAADPVFPGFTRVIWHHHVREMTDLDIADQSRLMRIVLRVESIMREVLQPDKINLASLGNQVPHLHWHIIPRWQDDIAFPGAVWAAHHTETDAVNRANARASDVSSRLPDYHQRLINEFRIDT